MAKSEITYLDGTWYREEGDELYPVNRYEAVDMLLTAIKAAEQNKIGTVMEILCMDESYTMDEVTKLVETRMKELSAQGGLEL